LVEVIEGVLIKGLEKFEKHLETTDFNVGPF
jgi:hypothetical protein